MSNWIGAAIAFVSLAISGAVFYVATRASRSRDKSAEKAVDAQAYERAKEIYEAAITQLRQTSTEVEAERDRLRESNSLLHAEVGKLRTEVGKLRTEVNSLRASNEQLTSDLADIRAKTD